MKNPIQPLIFDEHAVQRFKSNRLVVELLKHGQKTGLGLNELACIFHEPEHDDDWRQLAQLIGYSLSGYGDLNYVDDDAWEMAAQLGAGVCQEVRDGRGFVGEGAGSAGANGHAG